MRALPTRQTTHTNVTRAQNWISDRDVAMLVERLPEAQRQVLVMRFLLGLPTQEIAARLGSSEDAVRQLQARAFRGVRERLSPLRGGRGRRSPTRERIGGLPVLAARRFAIAYGGRPPGGPPSGGRSGWGTGGRAR